MRTARLQQKIGTAAAFTSAGLMVILAAGCSPSSNEPSTPVADVRGDAISAPLETAQAAQSTDSVQPVPTNAAGAAPTNASKSTEPARPADAITKTEDGFLQIGFDRLAAFNYEVPDGPVEAKEGETATNAKTNQIPEVVTALNNKKIALQGFMLPLKVENGLITELLIMRDQSMCCYGSVPKINEWVSVKMTGKGVKPIMDQAVTLYGTLKVGEMLENGYLVGIYQMDGERMAGPLEL